MDHLEWAAASPKTRERFCRDLVARLPSGFAFVGLAEYALGDQQRVVGEFELDNSRFVYVPGGEVELGFDAAEWEPTEEERRSYQYSAEDYGLSESIREYTNACTGPRRRATVASMVVEQRTQEPGWTPISPSDAREAMGDAFPDPPSSVQLVHGDMRVRCRVEVDGVSYASANGETRDDIEARIAPFRLPANDEWEYLCGAGSSSLYRWGNHAPCDHYPVDVRSSHTDFHLQPTACGVFVTGDPYISELMSDRPSTRGGDGGVMICGGAGFFLGWLALATAFEDPYSFEEGGSGVIDGDYVAVRRVISLW